MLFQILLCMLPFTLAHWILPPLNKNVIEDDLERFFDDDPSAGIVGGDVAPKGSHPWMAAVLAGMRPRLQHCGGSIVSKRTVLTAAHCVMGNLGVVVGTHLWKTGGQELNVAKNLVHPQYSRSQMTNDIGLLFLATDVVFSATVKPVVLNFQHVGDRTPLLVAGWGDIKAGGPSSAQLLQVAVTSLSTNECKSKMKSELAPLINDAYHLCTFRDKGHGACNGDSGSALTNENTHEQVGIVSFGIPCAVGYPDVFTRVSSYESFLKKNIV